jgi:16S rRNA (uracil1498-N3)-methyltransferase
VARHACRTPRLFVAADLRAGAAIPLDRNQTNYLRNVLRLAEGAEVLVFNGRDGEWSSRHTLASRREAWLSVAEQTRSQAAASELGYAFAPLKHARLDYMVQKAVEMGAGRLTPVLTRHTQVGRINLERMRANAIKAAEQCGILWLPTIDPPARLEDWLASRGQGPIVFCDEEADNGDPLATLEKLPAGAITLLIGPEGGFAADERRALLARPEVVRISLGLRILRADTAAVAALALIQAVRGNRP